jgi:predicted RNase H-like nuclease (RuvC/YqgF family)
MYLIIGVDPGTTTGIAAVTLDGSVYRVYSARNMGVDQVVKYVTSLGRPSLIASDVTPTPDSVMKIAASLGCSVFTLFEPLSVSEKNTLVSGYDVEDLHSRDALAAALNAFNKYRNKLEKIAALGYGDDVKHRVLQGVSLERALGAIRREKEKAGGEPNAPSRTPSRLSEKVMSISARNKLLEEELKLKDFEIAKLRQEISMLKTKPKEKVTLNSALHQQEQVIDSMEYKIKTMERKLGEFDTLKNLWRDLASGKLSAVGIYPEIYSGVTFARYRLQPEDAERLKDAKLVFTSDLKNRELLSKADIPAAEAKSLSVWHDLAYLPAGELQKLFRLKTASLESIISEYREERSR